MSLTWKLNAQVSRGIVKEGLLVPSKILGKDVRYTIYLPYDYETSERYYPVVYLLHGYTDNDIAWIQFGEANMTADKEIAEQKIPAIILVTPDAGITRYINNYDGSVKYEDFFIKEFIPYIEQHYRILAEKRYRAIAGLSMGGYGALVYALKHPDLFSSCVAFSAGIYTDEQIFSKDDNDWKAGLGVVFGPNLKGKDRLTLHFKENDPFYIVKNADMDKIKSVRFYLGCGDKDGFSEANSYFHILLIDLKIPHEYRVREGNHNWEYWRTGLPDALKFIGASFHQQ